MDAVMRIVYAEDDPLVRQTIATLLVGQGVDVIEAGDGEEAIWLCRVFHPNVVVLDLGMPHMDGFETARRLRETAAGKILRIVALTAYGDDEHQQMAKRAGFDEFLSKPISMNTIVDALWLCN
jgi:CheY-like chemotaxis protein